VVRVVGRLHGKAGAVVLQTQGGFDGPESRWSWRVNPGSQRRQRPMNPGTARGPSIDAAGSLRAPAATRVRRPRRTAGSASPRAHPGLARGKRAARPRADARRPLVGLTPRPGAPRGRGPEAPLAEANENQAYCWVERAMSRTILRSSSMNSSYGGGVAPLLSGIMLKVRGDDPPNPSGS
jgi:hypothetical protein